MFDYYNVLLLHEGTNMRTIKYFLYTVVIYSISSFAVADTDNIYISKDKNGHTVLSDTPTKNSKLVSSGTKDTVSKLDTNALVKSHEYIAWQKNIKSAK